MPRKSTKPAGAKPTKKSAKKVMHKQTKAEPKLLSGGNPQIPKGDGEEPVQAYLAAMPGWKGDVGYQLDA